MGDRMQLTGVFRFGWVIPALVVLPAIAVAYWRLIWAVPNPARALMFTAAALYLGGAVGMGRFVLSVCAAPLFELMRLRMQVRFTTTEQNRRFAAAL
jgi:hypothetical protein